MIIDNLFLFSSLYEDEAADVLFIEVNLSLLSISDYENDKIFKMFQPKQSYFSKNTQMIKYMERRDRKNRNK